MLFTTREFLLALAVTVAVYFALPARFRWPLLLAASYGFYAAGEPRFVVLLLFISVVVYIGGLAVAAQDGPSSRRIALLLSLLALFAPLALFKYADFVLQSSGLAAALDWPALKLGLPLGISFFTFQGASYVIEVYRGEIPAERNLGVLLLYKAYFPQLIAGPIERPGRLLPQLRGHAGFEFDRLTDGALLLLWGLVKKLVIADNLAVYVDGIYARPQEHAGLPLLLATLFFAFQIYCDFSGYVDMARGMSRMFGIELMRNFDTPYSAISITDFWRRWHISLSTWFRDYVYIPLGGSRVTMPLQLRNIAVVFILSGLWHGAAWTFVVWGALHGTYMAIGLLTRPLRQRLVAFAGLDQVPVLLTALQVLSTFALVNIAWVFFRATSLSDAFHVLTNLATPGGSIADFARASGATVEGAWALLAAIAILWLTPLAVRVERGVAFLQSRPWAQWAGSYSAIMAILFLSAADSAAFIYFRF